MATYIPRNRMPQIATGDICHMIADAEHAGHVPQFCTVNPAHLKAHQLVDRSRVEALKANPGKLMKPLIVSSDGYICDGNHRHAAALALGLRAAPCVVLEMEFDAALDWLLALPYVTEAKHDIPKAQREAV